jgi:membrane-associated phospholipid phosphatase
VQRLVIVVRIWLLLLAICAVLMAVSFVQIDVPMAQHLWKFGASLGRLDSAFGAATILTVESAVVLSLILVRLVRGRISPFGEALAIACLASICTYAINNEVLKPLFGVPSPVAVMEGAKHSFHWLGGSENSSFPSGHMVLAGAFAGVFMSFRRASVWLLTALLLFAAVLLIVGDWHFLSDVIAGTFVGVSAGMLAWEAWSARFQRSA